MAVPSTRIDVAAAAGTRGFLEAWYGPPPNPIVDVPGDAPDALRQWWAWEEAWGRKLTKQNSMLSRDELFEDSDQTVFYVENQAVMFWGFEGEGDPPVSERWNDARQPWVPLGVPLSTFLHQVAMLEATVLGHQSLSGHLDRGQLDRLTIGLTEFPSQIWPRGSFYAGEALLVNVQANTPDDTSEDGPWWTLISARSAQDLAGVDDTIDARWDYDSRTKR